jgi:Carboxypeptidase regulatory-like domain/TonB dependent receptor
MIESLVRTSLVLGLLALTGAPLLAQTTGTIRGTVTDAQGGLLPGVTVTARSPALVRGSASVVTDAVGAFRLPGLQPGVYEVVLELAGFTPQTISQVSLGLEQEILLQAVLQVAAVAEAVEVRAEAPLIEASRSGMRERIEPETIENMPLNGRQFLDLVQLVPGASPRPPDVEEGFGATVLGGRSTTNGFLIDGMQNRDNFTGGFKEFFVQDAIREFNVNIAGFQPEYGLASGAVVNIITRSGTNTLSGVGFAFGRHDAFDSSNVEGQDPPRLRRSNVGGTMGGPLRRDQTWFFYAIENLHETRGINLDLSQVPEIIRSGFATPSLDGVEPFDVQPITRRLTQFGKVNHRISARHQIFGSANWNHNSNDSLVRPPGGGFIAPPAGSVSMPSTASDVREDIFSVNGRETAFFGGDRGFVESTLRYVRGSFEENIDRGGGATDEISLLAGGRFWNTNFPLVGAQRTTDSRFEWAEDVSYYTGSHSLKFGFHYDRLNANGFYRTPTLNIIANTALERRYRDLGMDLTNQQSVRVLLPVDGREGYDIDDSIYSLYGQDSWQPSNNLTVNYGLRWDYESLFGDAGKNFAPRGAVMWDPWANGKTVLRAGGGIFYDSALLGPALLAPELGGSTIGLFSFWSMPRGGAFFNNPGLGALGSLQAGGTRWLANPALFTQLMPAGQVFTSGALRIVGEGRPYAIYELLGIPVTDPASPPVLTAESIPRLTNGRFTPEQALGVLNGAFPSPLGFPQFFYVPSRFAGQVMREGMLAFKFRTADIEQEDIQSIQEPFKTPYVVSLNAGIERELFAGTSVDVQYFRRLGIRQPARRVANLADTPRSSSCLGNTTDGRPCNRQLQPIGFSRTHAVALALRQRFRTEGSMLISYTYTHATDNFNTLNQRGGGGNFNLNNQPELDIGRSLNTPEHVFAASGMYRLPGRIDVSGVFRATSGRPFNAAGLPVDTDGDANLDNRLISTRKGEFETDPFAELDLRVAKPFEILGGEITVLAEVFNLLNRANPLEVQRAFGPTIGTTLIPLPGREWQFGVRYQF